MNDDNDDNGDHDVDIDFDVTEMNLLLECKLWAKIVLWTSQQSCMMLVGSYSSNKTIPSNEWWWCNDDEMTKIQKARGKGIYSSPPSCVCAASSSSSSSSSSSCKQNVHVSTLLVEPFLPYEVMISIVMIKKWQSW